MRSHTRRPSFSLWRRARREVRLHLPRNLRRHGGRNPARRPKRRQNPFSREKSARATQGTPVSPRAVPVTDSSGWTAQYTGRAAWRQLKTATEDAGGLKESYCGVLLQKVVKNLPYLHAITVLGLLKIFSSIAEKTALFRKCEKPLFIVLAPTKD